MDGVDPNETSAPAAERVAHAALRGAVAAMAMTGMRVLTVSLGIVDEPPPQAIFRQRAKGLLRIGSAAAQTGSDRARPLGLWRRSEARYSRRCRPAFADFPWPVLPTG